MPNDDPVVHDHDLNEAFRSEIPKKPEPQVDMYKLEWLMIVPKFQNIRGVQITADNMALIAKLHGWEMSKRAGGVDALIVPGIAGDVPAIVNDWILIANDDWNIVNVCTPKMFNRSYEVKS